jgi:hypothetical protein
MRLAWHAHVFAILGLLLVVPCARAEHGKAGVRVDCARAAEKAQQLRIDGHLMDARGALHACLRPACPKVIRSYCTRWFDEVESDLPSVVVSVHDASGNDLSGVTLTVDSKIEDSWRAGLPIELDPGEHLFRYERAGSKRLETRVRVSLGEKKRLLSVTLEEAMDGFQEAAPEETLVASDVPEDSEIAAAPSKTPPLSSQTSEPAHRKRVAAWVMSGTAVAALGSFAYFGITGRSDLSQLRHDCAGHCASSKVDAAWDKLIIADVSLGLAVLSTGLATWLFVASREKRGRQRDEARHIVPSVALLPDKRSFGLGLGARF